MEQAMTPSEMANALGLPALKDRKWQIFKTSATKGTGLDEAMEWQVSCVRMSNPVVIAEYITVNVYTCTQTVPAYDPNTSEARQEGQELKATFRYWVSSKLAWATSDFVSKKEKAE